MNPLAATIAPRKLTTPVVTNPANNNARPNAATRGHAVGAGNFTTGDKRSGVSAGGSIDSRPIFHLSLAFRL
jgi:hypothetical protein